MYYSHIKFITKPNVYQEFILLKEYCDFYSNIISFASILSLDKAVFLPHERAITSYELVNKTLFHKFPYQIRNYTLYLITNQREFEGTEYDLRDAED